MKKMGNPLEQHFLQNTSSYKALLNSIDLRKRKILEIGVGTGRLTELILECDPQEILGYEIDPSLCQITDPRLTLINQDITQVDLGTLALQNFALISNPSYSLLRFVREIIDKLKIQVAILMIPASKKPSLKSLILALS